MSTCPVCGSSNVVDGEPYAYRYTPPFGQEFVRNIPVKECRSCTEIIFDDHSDELMAAFIHECDIQTVPELVATILRNLEITTTALERQLSLPMGTLKRFETECSPEGLALLRIIRAQFEA